MLKATTPCYKFINATSKEQLSKTREELEEVGWAWQAYLDNKNNVTLKQLLVELLDVQSCISTAIAQIVADVNTENYCRHFYPKFGPIMDFEQAKQCAENEVVNKNWVRGYYKKGGK